MTDPFRELRYWPDENPTPIRIYRPDAIDIRIERILLAIEVHGPSVAYEEPNRTFIRSLFHVYPSAFWQIKKVVESEAHAQDCACWDCVERLCFELLRPWLMEAGAKF